MATQQHGASEPLGSPDLQHHELLRKDHKLLNGCVPLSHQVAGHMYGKDKVGILQHPDGTVLKQLQPPPRGPRELDFYNMVFSSDCTDPKLHDLQMFLPKYFGTWSPPGSTNDLYLKLEDVTRKFNKPCIMDVKIGQKSYDPHASAEKIQQQISKYPLMEEIGFLVLGMRCSLLTPMSVSGTVQSRKSCLWGFSPALDSSSYDNQVSAESTVDKTKKKFKKENNFLLSHTADNVYHMDSNNFEIQNQHYGRSLTKDTIKHGLSNFFNNGYYLRKDAVSACLQKVKNILQWFENQDTLHFYASSLLFVYDGSCPESVLTVDGKAHAKKVATTDPFREEEVVTECNNNISMLNPVENGKNEEQVEKKWSRIHTANKKMCLKRLHSEAFLVGEIITEDKSRKNNGSQEHLNGNLLTKLENALCQVSTDLRDSTQVDVRMIDFAHVFPSEGKDLGYIYGLKNLIAVLQRILDE